MRHWRHEMTRQCERRLEALEDKYVPANEVFCPLEHGESSRNGRRRYEAEHGPQSPNAHWIFTSLLIDDEPVPDHDPLDEVRCVHVIVVAVGSKHRFTQEISS